MQIILFELLPNNRIGPQHILLSENVTVGRSPQNDLQIEKIEISRQHIRIYASGSQFFVEDLQSSNGTWVNKRTLIGKRKLANGDVIDLAMVTRFQFIGSTGSSGTSSIQPSQAALKPIYIDWKTEQVFVRQREIKPQLDKREFRILSQLYDQSRIVTAHELMKFWPPDEAVTEPDIDQVIRRLRDRIALVDDSRQYIQTIPGVGYLMNNTYTRGYPSEGPTSRSRTAKLESQQKTVFISCRRSLSRYLARSIYQHLKMHQWDVFLDVNTIDSGDFDRIILEQIAARAHFILLISEGSLERCSNPGDWLVREMQEAVRLERNIVPVFDEGVRFRDELKHLPDELATIIRKKNALPLSHFFFDAAMEMLRTRFLKTPEYIQTTDISKNDQIEVKERIATLQQEIVQLTTMADQQMEKIGVRQKVSVDTGALDDQPTYDISLHLEAPPEVLNQIAYVRYKIVPDKRFIPKSDNRASKFRIQASYVRADQGIPIEVHFIDKSIGRIDHELKAGSD